MKKVTIILFAACLMAGCRATRSISSSDYVRTSDREEHQSHYESLYVELRDSLARVPAPAESSQNYGLLRSFLETSFAWSTAEIDSLGRLLHRIGNKDSIPTRVIIRDVHHFVHDTAETTSSDSLRAKEYQYIEKDLTAFQQIQIRGFWLLLIGVGAFLLVWIARTKLKKLRII